MSVRKSLSEDTCLEAEDVQIAIFRQMPPGRKLQLVWDACDATRQWMMAGLRMRHPDESEENLRRRLARLWLGEPLSTIVYGPEAP